MEENKIISDHKLQLNNRKKGALTGVLDVMSFDEKEVRLQTKAGALTIRGTDLSITRLNLEKGEVDVSGHVESMVYTKESEPQNQKGKRLLHRLFQ